MNILVCVVGSSELPGYSFAGTRFNDPYCAIGQERKVVSVDFHAINRCIFDSPFFPPNPCILDVCTEDQLILERTEFVGELPRVH